MISDQKQKDFSLEALRNGDRAEFSRLVEEYSPMIYRLGLKMLNNQQDAEDILQETFIKAYNHIGKFDGRSSVSTWLYRIATNEALMTLRKKRLDTVSFDMPSIFETEPQEPLQIVDWCCLPEEEFLSAEARLRLDEAAERLPDSLRVVFVLRDIEGLSTRETAEVLEISEAAVKTRLSRARLRLREDLSTYFGQLVDKG
jgi:RNA polymerase sigma-70 factor (ECF subfamily)